MKLDQDRSATSHHLTCIGLLNNDHIILITLLYSCLQHLVVVITDGVSNVKPDQTIPVAEDLHRKGIEVR